MSAARSGPSRAAAARGVVASVMLVLAGACGDSPAAPGDSDPSTLLTDGTALYGYRVVARHPHDPEAFTQGLVLDDGVLLEGTGLYGQSSLRRVERSSGAVLQERLLGPEFFGEGIAVAGNRIVQLTWKAGTAFVYDLDTFTEEDRFSYETEGWGLTWDGSRLVMSDGSASLHFRNPDSFEPLESVVVRDEGRPLPDLNELEYVEGHVLANVWQTDRIAVIEPSGGDVVSWIDLEGILPPEDRPGTDVLNGIAFDETTGHLLVTGKLWPWLFEIELVPEG